MYMHTAGSRTLLLDCGEERLYIGRYRDEVSAVVPVCTSDFWGAATTCEDKGGYCAAAGGTCEVLSYLMGSCYCKLSDSNSLCGILPVEIDDCVDNGCDAIGGQCDVTHGGRFCQCMVPI